jgi:hypothetical protein
MEEEMGVSLGRTVVIVAERLKVGTDYDRCNAGISASDFSEKPLARTRPNGISGGGALVFPVLQIP